MKTNTIFNLKRFKNYALSSLILRYRNLLLLLGVASFGILLLCFFILLENGHGWNNNDWAEFVTFIISIAGILYVGSSFPYLRTREKTQSALMVPSSTMEKFLYEFTERILLFFIMFPLILFLFGNMALMIVDTYNSAKGVVMNASPLSYGEMISDIEGQGKWVIIEGALFVLSLAFAGAVTFRKYPLVKTVVFVCSVLSISAGYFVLIFEKLHLNHPWLENLGDHLSKTQGLTLSTFILLLLSLITLSFAYFKLKEKEVQ